MRLSISTSSDSRNDVFFGYLIQVAILPVIAFSVPDQQNSRKILILNVAFDKSVVHHNYKNDEFHSSSCSSSRYFYKIVGRY